MYPSSTPRKFFLAIKHRPSGGFLPAVRGYGFTRTKPSLEEAPRLFTKIGPAKQALSYWLEGELYEGVEYETDTGMSTTVQLVKRPERRACDMEIVEIEVVVRSLNEAQLRRL